MVQDNKKEIIEKGDKVFLFSPQDYERLSDQVDELSRLYRLVGDTLREYGYPTPADWQFSIIEEGAEALERLVRDDAKNHATRLRVQRYLTDSWIETALSGIPQELKNKLSEISSQIRNKREGLPLLKKDISFRERTILLDVQSLKDRLRESLTIEVPKQVLEDVKKMRETILSVRELESRGIYAKEAINRLSGEYLAPSLYPSLDDVTLLEKVFLRKHRTRDEVLASNPDYVLQIEKSTEELLKRGLYGITLPPASPIS